MSHKISICYIPCIGSSRYTAFKPLVRHTVAILSTIRLPLDVVVNNTPRVSKVLGQEAEVQHVSSDGHVRHPLGRVADAVERAKGRRGDGEAGVGLVVLVEGGEELLTGGEPLGLATGAEVAGEVHADAAVKGAQPDDVDVGDLGEDSVEVVNAYVCQYGSPR